jgi:hypothetical protein
VIASAAVCVLLSAAPSGSWKVDVVHKEDLRGNGKKKGADYTAPALLTEQFILAITEAGDPRPKGVELTMLKGTLGKVTVSGERGEAYVRLEHPPADMRLRNGLIRYLDRLVVEDPLRPAMSTCDAASQRAVEEWLHKTMAWITVSQPSEITVKDVKVKCSKTGSGVKHDVSLGVSADGKHGIHMTLKGKVIVDPAVWATTWSISGPMKVVFDKGTLALPMEGTFTSSFGLAKK